MLEFFDTDCYEPEVIQRQVETLGLLLGKTILKQVLHLLLFSDHFSAGGSLRTSWHLASSAEHCTICPVLGLMQNGFGRTSPGTHCSTFGWPGPSVEKPTPIH